MLLTEIKREAVALPTEFTSDVAALAGDAEKLLGYSLLRQSLDEPTEMPELLKVLSDLCIEILNKPSVVLYMRQKLVDRTIELMGEWEKGEPDPLRSWASFSGPSWASTEISKYKEPIPEFVINKAVQIKQVLPQVGVYIVHLTKDKDPFLKVTLGKQDEWNDKAGEAYFVEVWEEPKFEGRI